MANISGMSSITITDAPPKPATLTLTLKEKTMWTKFCESTANFSPQKFLEAFDNEKQKLMKKIQNGTKLTQEDCDFLNKNVQKRISEVLDNFKDQALAQMAITPEDTAEEVQAKLSVAEQLITWLSALFDWLNKKISEIFAKIRECFDWCVKKAKELFDYLWSLLG